MNAMLSPRKMMKLFVKNADGIGPTRLTGKVSLTMILCAAERLSVEQDMAPQLGILCNKMVISTIMPVQEMATAKINMEQVLGDFKKQTLLKIWFGMAAQEMTIAKQ